jgi:hypothetical protein
MVKDGPIHRKFRQRIRPIYRPIFWYVRKWNAQGGAVSCWHRIHSKGWTREQAIQFSMANEAESAAITTEIERYMAIPGQAIV